MDFNKLYILQIFVPTERICSKTWGYIDNRLCTMTSHFEFQDIENNIIYDDYRINVENGICKIIKISDYYDISGKRLKSLKGINQTDEERLVKEYEIINRVINKYDVFSRKNKIIFLLTAKKNVLLGKKDPKVLKKHN